LQYYDDMRHGDPILETAYYLAVARRGETRVLLVQGRSVEQTDPVAIVSSRSTPMTSQEQGRRPSQDSPGSSAAGR
jgi:hypothetical protein